ncbi:MAG TPA: NADP-dependent oxidoreductase [Solirubrobacteraceae bacterium]|jgi:NADPH:quinone reductase-like Zn-dependent oxidoreductase
MHAIAVSEFGGPEVLELRDVPIPEPGPGQLRVRVRASTVAKIDISTRNGAISRAGLLAPHQDVGLGWDVAGTVDAVGTGVRRFTVGDEVIGLRDLLFAFPGAHAEQVVLHEGALARAPRGTPYEQAATIPLAGLTADRALALADLQPGQTLLVTGAAGGVGGFVLELARLRNLRTIAVASPTDEALVGQLGATDFVARTDALGQAVRNVAPGGVDAVVDTAVLGIAAHEALRGGGTFVALVAPFAPPPIRGTNVVVQEVYADGGRLAELSALAEARRLTLRVAQTIPLAEAAKAHQLAESGGQRGRIVLQT